MFPHRNNFFPRQDFRILVAAMVIESVYLSILRQ